MSELEDLARQVAERAGPDEQIEAYVARGRRTSVRAWGGQVESLTVAESSGVGIRVVVGERQGFAHCGTLDPEVVTETLVEARHNASFAEPDPFAGLAEPDGVAAVDQDLWDEGVVATTTADKVEMALELERRTTGIDPRVARVRNAVYGDGAGEAAVATSTGIVAHGRATMCSVSVSALADDGDATRTGGGWDVARSPAGLDVEVASQDAVERAVRLLGAEPAPSCTLAVVLEPRLAATVLGLLGGTLAGDRVAKGRSPFADRVGEQIASPLLDLVDDPTDARSFGAEVHDGEGLACRPTPLLTAGVLQGFLHDTWSGRRAGAASTASAVRSYRSTPGVGHQALAVAPGSGTLDDLVAGVDDGLLVASLTGVGSGVNAISGDVSVGAEGIRIRGGELAEPVREVTLASTLPRMLLDIEAVGDDREWLPGGTGACSMVIGGMRLSGT